MAFNKAVFRTRALSAIVFVLIMAVGLLWNQWSFLVLLLVIHVGCWREYFRLVRAIRHEDEDAGYAVLWQFTLLGLGLCLFMSFLRIPGMQTTVSEIGWGVIRTTLAGILFVLLYYRKSITARLIATQVAGLLYISLPLALLVYLRTQWGEVAHPYALAIPLLIICNNWINDTMAYLVGSFVGKTPFSSISPKKTWEGTIGGVLLAVLTISCIAYVSGWLPLHHAAALSLIGAVSGTYGDLFESKLKRMAGVKDSGTMMPGHGGFLDRFDSLLFSATACAVYLWLAM